MHGINVTPAQALAQHPAEVWIEAAGVEAPLANSAEGVRDRASHVLKGAH